MLAGMDDDDVDRGQRVVLGLLLSRRQKRLSEQEISSALPDLTEAEVDYALTRLSNDGLVNRLEGSASASWAATRMDQLGPI